MIFLCEKRNVFIEQIVEERRVDEEKNVKQTLLTIPLNGLFISSFFHPLRRRLRAEGMCLKQICTAFSQHVQDDKQLHAKGVLSRSLVRC